MPDEKARAAIRTEDQGQGPSEPLVWHPLIRALAWVANWCAISIFLAVLWEFAATGELTRSGVFTRGLWLLLAIGLMTGVLFAAEVWFSFFMHARKNYDGSFQIVLVSIATLVISAILAAYLWGATWVLDQAWPLLEGWIVEPQRGSERSTLSIPIWVELPLTIVGTVVVFALLPRTLRQLSMSYRDGFRLLGPRRAIRGMLVMCLLRLRAPRRDLFGQAPVISWIPGLAISVLLYSLISVPGLKLVFAIALAILLVAMQLDLIAPPLWLFLGTSRYDSFAAFEALRRYWRKHGVTLIDRTNQHGTGYYYHWRRNIPMPGILVDPTVPRVWSVRTKPDLWVNSVHLLMSHVLVVVVDVRGDSDIVRQEVDWVTERGHRAKTWYLAGDEKGMSDADWTGVTERYPALGASERPRVVSGPALLLATWSKAGLSVPAEDIVARRLAEEKAMNTDA